ncbi:MAG: hypothetical protein FWD80_02125 [Propionibacteriaceae bacterium]|nr:hypothetical protein [Propionibacteriaceae bacterium]
MNTIQSDDARSTLLNLLGVVEGQPVQITKTAGLVSIDHGDDGYTAIAVDADGVGYLLTDDSLLLDGLHAQLSGARRCASHWRRRARHYRAAARVWRREADACHNTLDRIRDFAYDLPKVSV